MWQGLYLACNEPTALTLMIQATSSFFIAHMFARWFSSPGTMRCPRACRGRKTTSLPPRLPVRNWSEGGPKGVLMLTHFCRVNPSIWYSPLPPIMPIRCFAISQPIVCDRQVCRAKSTARQQLVSRSDADGCCVAQSQGRPNEIGARVKRRRIADQDGGCARP